MSLRCFAFRGLITQAQIWKSFLVQNSTSLLYLNPFLHLLKLGKSLQTSCVNFFFFAWTDILGEKNPYFGKHLLHGCDVTKMFCFSWANHTSTNLKKFFSSKLNKFTLFKPIPSSAETWKIFTNKLCQFFFFCLNWHFRREKSVFWKASFAKQELI